MWWNGEVKKMKLCGSEKSNEVKKMINKKKTNDEIEKMKLCVLKMWNAKTKNMQLYV